MPFDSILLLFWSALVFWVLGQIWLAQVVVYPLFARVGEREYVDYHKFYSSRILLPVIIPGFLSFLVPVALFIFGPPLPLWMNVGNVLTGLCGLAVTVLLAIPRHARLETQGKDDVTIAALIRVNWPRTVSISVQAVITFMMLLHDAAR